ncbi:MAG TPA: lysophospholipid acyltransferase family protein [Rickettsiales bacterium]|nr:lysophospholipid acyltransferase family protein [Rickettsiales bacterium]
MARLAIRALLTVLALLVLLLPFYITTVLKMRHANAMWVRWGFHFGSWLWGLKVQVEGTVSPKRPLLLVSNHFSYLDVFALGGVADMRFTPKSEVASWPVIGFFCKITGCVFVDRRRSKTAEYKQVLHEAVQSGVPLSLFPEGTTNEGASLLPFKSSFFSIADNEEVSVQPISVIYEKVNGAPLTLANRHLVGWYGDMDFFPHAAAFLRQKSANVRLIFHPEVKGSAFASRKELAAYCESVISPTIPKLV